MVGRVPNPARKDNTEKAIGHQLNHSNLSNLEDLVSSRVTWGTWAGAPSTLTSPLAIRQAPLLNGWAQCPSRRWRRRRKSAPRSEDLDRNGRSLATTPSFHGCCWETVYIFAYCGLGAEIQPLNCYFCFYFLLPFQRQPSFQDTASHGNSAALRRRYSYTGMLVPPRAEDLMWDLRALRIQPSGWFALSTFCTSCACPAMQGVSD